MQYQNNKVTFNENLSDGDYDDNDIFWAVPLEDPDLDKDPIKCDEDVKRCLWFSGHNESDDEVVFSSDYEYYSSDLQ